MHQWSKAKRCNFIDVSENLDSLHNGGGSGWRAGESWENHYIILLCDREAGPMAPPTPTRPSFKFASHHGGGGHAHCTDAATINTPPPHGHIRRSENVIITISGQFRTKLLPRSTASVWLTSLLLPKHPPPVTNNAKSCWQSHPWHPILAGVKGVATSHIIIFKGPILIVVHFLMDSNCCLYAITFYSDK